MKFIVFSVLLIFLIGCKNKNEKIDVNQFVSMIKNGSYPYDNQLDFSTADIPALLKYANDTTEIAKFPTCPQSNLGSPGENYIMGECMLFTIESIRVTYYQPDWHKRFPSALAKIYKVQFDSIENIYLLNMSTTPEPDIKDYYLSRSELQNVYNKYKNWWNDNQSKSFDEFRDINPLEGMELSWYGKVNNNY